MTTGKTLHPSGLLSTEWDPCPSFRSSSLLCSLVPGSWLGWAFRITGKPSEFPPSCFSETRNSFTKSESQPECNSQRRNEGLGLGMCERHLQMTGNCSPSICGGHRDSAPSLTLYFENWQGPPRVCGSQHTTTGFCSFLKLARGGCVENMQLPCSSSHHKAAERALGETAWEEGTISKSRDGPSLLFHGVQTSEVGSVQDNEQKGLISLFAAKGSKW